MSAVEEVGKTVRAAIGDWQRTLQLIAIVLALTGAIVLVTLVR